MFIATASGCQDRYQCQIEDERQSNTLPSDSSMAYMSAQAVERRTIGLPHLSNIELITSNKFEKGHYIGPCSKDKLEPRICHKVPILQTNLLAPQMK